MRGSGRDFFVLYVPQAEEVEGRVRDEDTWRLWLADSCRALDLELIDPTAALGGQPHGVTDAVLGFTPHREFHQQLSSRSKVST